MCAGFVGRHDEAQHCSFCRPRVVDVNLDGHGGRAGCVVLTRMAFRLTPPSLRRDPTFAGCLAALRRGAAGSTCRAEPPQLATLARAFEQATGWQLRCEHGPAVPGEVWSTTIDTFGRQRESRLVLTASPTEADQAAALDLHRARPLRAGGRRPYGRVEPLAARSL